MPKWNGSHFRIAFTPVPPWVSVYENDEGQIRLHGLIGSMMGNITESMNMTYEAIPTIDGTYGAAFANGNYTGQLAMAFNGQAEIAVGPFPIHEFLHPDLGTLPAFIHTQFQFLQGMRHPFITRPTSFFGVFDGLTWLLMWLTLVITGSLLTLDKKPAGQRQPILNRVMDSLMEMFAIWFQEAVGHRFNATWARMIGAMWLLGTLVMSQSFGSNLRANSMIRQPTLRINGVDDLVKHENTYTLLFSGNSPLEDALLTRPGSTGETLRKMTLRGRRLDIANYYKEADVKDVRNSKAIYADERFHSLHFLQSECPRTKFFYYLSAEHFQHLMPSPLFGPHVNKELVRKVANKINILKSMKVPFMTHHELYPVPLTCLVDSSKAVIEIKQFSLADLQFTFTAYFVGLASSAVVLLVEALIWGVGWKRFWPSRQRVPPF